LRKAGNFGFGIKDGTLKLAKLQKARKFQTEKDEKCLTKEQEGLKAFKICEKEILISNSPSSSSSHSSSKPTNLNPKTPHSQTHKIIPLCSFPF
jgi:hypothetical protein